ncbi:hypothetical protein AB0K15_48005 [Amycolatopsis sp. NPDC049253]|uniref:hypothetical protein n=1 Tax=Amycolatopsis sp. NPDC049253 TaxID=3155274 RepID=UPI00341DEB55
MAVDPQRQARDRDIQLRCDPHDGFQLGAVLVPALDIGGDGVLDAARELLIALNTGY